MRRLNEDLGRTRPRFVGHRLCLGSFMLHCHFTLNPEEFFAARVFVDNPPSIFHKGVRTKGVSKCWDLEAKGSVLSSCCLKS